MPLFYAILGKKQEKRAFFKVFPKKSAISLHFGFHVVHLLFYAILGKKALKRAFFGHFPEKMPISLHKEIPKYAHYCHCYRPLALAQQAERAMTHSVYWPTAHTV